MKAVLVGHDSEIPLERIWQSPRIRNHRMQGSNVKWLEDREQSQSLLTRKHMLSAFEALEWIFALLQH